MQSPAFVLAYHGCDESFGEKCLAYEDEVSVSENKHDWLGHGAYFWENSPARALQWAEFIKKNPQHSKHKITRPFIVGAIINLGNCLDLADAESLAIVKGAHMVLGQTCKVATVDMPANEAGYEGDADLVKRHLDCLVINAVHAIRKKEPFDSVRGIFTEGGELFPGSKIQEKTHVQICVRDPRKSVIAYFRPRTVK